MFFHQRFIPGLAIYSYLIADENTREAAVIDPTRDVGDFIELSRREGFAIRHVLETHVHADFVCGSAELRARLGDSLIVHASGLGGEEWTPPYADQVISDGDEIHLGKVRLRAFHTPGHTPEHLSWQLFDENRSVETPWLILSGDFLFVGDVGRPDLLGEEARQELADQLYGSVFEKLPGLPDFTEIFPGHGSGSLCGKAIGSRSASTLGYERRFSEALQPREKEAWISELLSGMPIAPPYFRRMKQVNSRGPRILGPELPGQRRFTAREVHERVCENCLILDVRSREAFASAHIPGAINIPLGAVLPTWAGWVLPPDRPILIVADDSRDVPPVLTHLLRVGFDEVQGYLEDGLETWQGQGFELARLEVQSVAELATRLRSSDPPRVLDVRTEKEWLQGHIEGARHIHGGLLQERHAEIPRDRPIAVICGSGYRGSIAASYLLREGFERVSNVLGGMSAWKSSGKPTVSGDA